MLASWAIGEALCLLVVEILPGHGVHYVGINIEQECHADGLSSKFPGQITLSQVRLCEPLRGRGPRQNAFCRNTDRHFVDTAKAGMRSAEAFIATSVGFP
ncbi:hypothetical protein C8Q72DRAFT_517933 [Fomitopsis betulina]|nr:hypothetical protein C8Q72DRAFT_517933 [Fomitopsis betulina]